MKKIILFLSLLISAHALSMPVGISLNNGLSLARLKVIDAGELNRISWDKNTIYVLPNTPPDIKPVSGVLTVGSGSRISHVQLLCRSLGIPNSAISKQEYEKLKEFDDKHVLYVAIDSRTAILKLADDLSDNEKKLIQEYKGLTKFEAVVLPRPNLNIQNLLSLDELDVTSSGKVVGPKAANLGFLKKLFPDRVADGFAIPFGAVNKLFEAQGVKQLILELNTITDPELTKLHLKKIRDSIARVNIPQDLLSEIQTKAQNLLNTNNGSGLFIRSDTNVEDLAQFSGAGLNKTVPNVLDLGKIEESIKLVWASPWSERSHAWRTQYIKNPEDILPSVLIMKSVDAKKAGVFATINFDTGKYDDIFVSASQGLGFKVVDGSESPEEWMINKGPEDISDRIELINIAFAKNQFVLDNINGGITEIPTTIDEILNNNELQQLDFIANKVKTISNFPVPFESEFGITSDGKVQLFQIRPLVLKGNALTANVLRKFYE